MSSQRQVQFVWTCDACGHVETVDDSGSGRPSNWGQIVHGRMHDRLGNLTEKHLCGDCRDILTRLLENRLGDTGDMAIAWDEGYARGIRDAETDAIDHADNPYST